MALALLSRRESRKDLWPRLITLLLLLYFKLLYSLLLLQDDGFQKMLVFDRTTPSSCLSNQASPPFDHPDIAHSILSCLH
uniref:Uncharacterized protein n=1 Tax=Triticum urartu TaxID=4572 RepID=A0A8R7V2S8_TRIUA